jgi:hypothetical protein
MKYTEKQLKEEAQKAYNLGVRDALEELSGLYDDIDETDLWKETFN